MHTRAPAKRWSPKAVRFGAAARRARCCWQPARAAEVTRAGGAGDKSAQAPSSVKIAYAGGYALATFTSAVAEGAGFYDEVANPLPHQAQRGRLREGIDRQIRLPRRIRPIRRGEPADLHLGDHSGQGPGRDL